MCADCSRGSADARHDHQPVSSNHSVLGLAGSETVLNRCLNEWRMPRPTIQVELQILWD